MCSLDRKTDYDLGNRSDRNGEEGDGLESHIVKLSFGVGWKEKYELGVSVSKPTKWARTNQHLVSIDERVGDTMKLSL